jgi:tetratricopeptide (TPR) repeat protein
VQSLIAIFILLCFGSDPYKEAMQLKELGAYSEALRKLETCMDTNEDCLYQAASCAQLAGEYNQAYELYLKAQQIEKYQINATVQLARLDETNGYKAEALAKYMSLYDAGFTTAGILKNIGKLRFALKEYEAALGFYEEAFAQNSKDAESAFWIAKILLESDRGKEALPYSKIVTKIWPQNLEAAILLQRIYFRLENYREVFNIRIPDLVTENWAIQPMIRKI